MNISEMQMQKFKGFSPLDLADTFQSFFFNSFSGKSENRRSVIFNVSEYIRKFITKTCLYNVDPLKPHFHIVKLGFTGVYIIFHISAQNIDCGYSLEPPRRGGSNEYPQSMFLSRHKKNIRIFI